MHNKTYYNITLSFSLTHSLESKQCNIFKVLTLMKENEFMNKNDKGFFFSKKFMLFQVTKILVKI